MSQRTKIVIVGNGFGGTYALKNLRKVFDFGANIQISLIGDKNYFLFTPLLHEVATGGINPSNIIEPIRKILGPYPNNFYLGKAEKINLEAEIVTMGETSIPYDYLILAPGAETNFYNISGAEKYSFTLKSIGDAIKIKNHLLSRMEHASHAKGEAERKKILKFVIVGGGATGVELAAEIAELISDTFARYYSKELIKDASIVLIQKDADLIPQFGVKMRGKSLEVLRKSGIEVMLSMGVTEVGVSYAIIDGGTKIDTETVIWVAGTKPATLNFDHAPERSRDGRVIVNEFLQLPNYKNVFIIGDMAAFTRSCASCGKTSGPRGGKHKARRKRLSSSIIFLSQFRHLDVSWTLESDWRNMGIYFLRISRMVVLAHDISVQTHFLQKKNKSCARLDN